MKCFNCGTELRPQDRFCPHCGAPAPEKKITCVNCGGQAEPGQLFCPHCGYRLTQQEDAGPNPEYRQEHREESKERQPDPVYRETKPQPLDRQVGKTIRTHIVLTFLLDLMLAFAGALILAEKESGERYGMDFDEILPLYLAIGLCLWVYALLYFLLYYFQMKKAMREKEEGRRTKMVQGANKLVSFAYLSSIGAMVIATGVLCLS